MIKYAAAWPGIRLQVASIVAGWATITATTWLANVCNTEPDADYRYRLWFWVTLAEVLALGALWALVVIDARRTRGVDARPSSVRVLGLMLGTGAWLLGGLWFFLGGVLFGGVALPHGIHCSLPGVHGQSHCLPVPLGEALGLIIGLSSTPALAVLIAIGRRSPVAAWLSPVLIVGLFVLARLLWGPRYG
ncbi:hypothetical protein ACQEU6_29170 [Spirillospora sp. CA-108201]